MLRLDDLERTLAVDGFTHDVDALFLQQAAQPGAIDLVIVDE
jgi:hypothetical protein